MCVFCVCACVYVCGVCVCACVYARVCECVCLCVWALAACVGRHVTDVAFAMGYARVVLDTLARLPAAIAVYTRVGYVPVPRYNDNPLPDIQFYGVSNPVAQTGGNVPSDASLVQDETSGPVEPPTLP